MISVRLLGGLGNQLFQIFTLISYGLKHAVRIIFPYSIEFTKTHTPRNTYWDSFLEPLKTFTTEYLQNNITNNELYKLPVYEEKSFNYETLPKLDNCMFNGSWQSYKYFHEMKDKIFQMIRLSQMKESVKTEYSRYFDENPDIQYISMHFRLGDYKTKQYYHPLLPYEYYEKAVECIIKTNKKN